MKTIIAALLLPVCVCSAVVAQQTQPAAKAKEAYLITRMAAQLHVQPRPLNETLSADLYKSVLHDLDPEHILFNTSDIQQLDVYRYTLHQQVAQQKTGFLVLLAALYNTRIHQADTMIANICSQPIALGKPEQLTAQEDSSYPAGIAAMHAKLYKLIKQVMLNDVVNRLTENHITGLQQAQQKADSLEPAVRKRTMLLFQRNIQRYLSAPHGLNDAIGNIYCKALALCYDPHTEYFPLSEKENFDSELGQKRYRFGFQLKENESGEVSIVTLLPGSPAFRSGLLSVGDKLQTLQWQGEAAVDISQAGVEEITDMLSSSNHDQLYLTVKKSDGSTRRAVLTKELASDNEEEEAEKVKNFMLKGSKNIGYISLPAFYTSWNNDDESGGCANDVTKAILKLKREKLDGLILDLRFNGGGSLQEAVALTGIFVDAGPVLQLTGRDSTTAYTLKDANRGTVYDGPLLVLVNGYSASASEIVAAALQDYNRAIIAGSATYGKATSQVIWPLDTLAIRSMQAGKTPTPTDAYLKITGERLFRINGNSAQFAGVQPDIVLPDLTDYTDEKEKNEPFALRSSHIAPNKYYRIYPALPVAHLRQKAAGIINQYPFFSAVKNYGTYLQQQEQPATTTLSLAGALTREEQSQQLQKALAEGKIFPHPAFSVENDTFDSNKLKTDAVAKEMNEASKKYVLTDPYIHFAFSLLSE